MDRDELAEWRRKRLVLLADEMGSRRALGQAIGHKTGAQIKSMAVGLRPLSDATMDKIEALPGRAGWFCRDGATPAAQALTLLACLRYLREELETMPADAKPWAQAALRRFVDHPDELLEVAMTIQKLGEE